MSTAAEFRRNPQLPLSQQCTPLINGNSLLKSEASRSQSFHPDSISANRNDVSNPIFHVRESSNSGLFHSWNNSNVHTPASFPSNNLNSPSFMSNSSFSSYTLPLHSPLVMHPSIGPNMILSNQCDSQTSNYYQMSQYRRHPQLSPHISAHESGLEYNISVPTSSSSVPYSSHLHRPTLNHNSAILSPYHSPNSVNCNTLQTASNMAFPHLNNSTNVPISTALNHQLDTNKTIYSMYPANNQNGFATLTSPMIPCNNVYRPSLSPEKLNLSYSSQLHHNVNIRGSHSTTFGSGYLSPSSAPISHSHHSMPANNIPYSNRMDVNDNKDVSFTPSPPDKVKTLSSYLLQHHMKNSPGSEHSPNSVLTSGPQTLEERPQTLFAARTSQQTDSLPLGKENTKRMKGKAKKSTLKSVTSSLASSSAAQAKSSPLYSLSTCIPQYGAVGSNFPATDGSNSSSDFPSASGVSVADGDPWLDEVLEAPFENPMKNSSPRLGKGRRAMKQDLNASPESILRREDRRKRNRESAQRCRARKNSALQELARRLKVSHCEFGTYFTELEKAFQVSLSLHETVSRIPRLSNLLSQFSVNLPSLPSTELSGILEGVDPGFQIQNTSSPGGDNVPLLLLHEEQCRKVSQYFQKVQTNAVHQSVRDALSGNVVRLEKFSLSSNTGAREAQLETSSDDLSALGSEVTGLLKSEPLAFTYNVTNSTEQPVPGFFSESLTSLLN